MLGVSELLLVVGVSAVVLVGAWLSGRFGGSKTTQIYIDFTGKRRGNDHKSD